ncbi:MAG: hydrogenase iron-sulfur subunit [Polyangiaceae bacterium]
MSEFEPKIVGFLCNWCSYAGADRAGANQTPIPPNMHVIRVMCSGRVDPQFIFAAFAKGADGVMVLGCHPGDCHYKEGNYRAAQRSRLVKRMLAEMRIEPERLTFDYVSAADNEKYVRLVREMVERLRALGPLELTHLSNEVPSIPDS